MPNIAQLHSDGNKWISKKNGSNNIPYITFHIKSGNPQIHRISKLNHALHTGVWKDEKMENQLPVPCKKDTQMNRMNLTMPTSYQLKIEIYKFQTYL